MSLWPDLKFPPINLWSAPALLSRVQMLADISTREPHPPQVGSKRLAPAVAEIRRLTKVR